MSDKDKDDNENIIGDMLNDALSETPSSKKSVKKDESSDNAMRGAATMLKEVLQALQEGKSMGTSDVIKSIPIMKKDKAEAERDIGKALEVISALSKKYGVHITASVAADYHDRGILCCKGINTMMDNMSYSEIDNLSLDKQIKVLGMQRAMLKDHYESYKESPPIDLYGLSDTED